MARKKATKKAGAEEVPAVPSPEPEAVAPVPAPEPQNKEIKALLAEAEAPKAPDVEIAELEAHIVVLRQRISDLQRGPIQEFPKMVKGFTVHTPEQEAAVLAGTAEIEEVQSADGVRSTVK